MAAMGAIAKLLKVVGPNSHHLPPLLHELCAVIGCAERATFPVGELRLDHIRTAACVLS